MHHQIARAFLTLRTGKGNLHSASRVIKTEATGPDQQHVILALAEQNPTAAAYLTGPVFAQSFAQVWAPTSSYRITNPQKAINWATSVLLAYGSTLKQHVEQKNRLESAFYKGNLSLCGEILVSHVATFGHSLWSAHWNLVLAEEVDASAGRIQLRDRYRNQGGEAAAPYFTDILAVAADKSVTEDRYRSLVRSSLVAGPLQPFLEMLFLEDTSDGWKSEGILAFADAMPLVDRYENFIKLACFGIGSQHADQVRFSRAICRLADEIPHDLTTYIAECVDHARDISFKKDVSDAFCVWDHYVVSEYEKTIEVAELLSNGSPWAFALNELAVKAKMYAGKACESAIRSPGLELHHHLFNVYAKNSHSDESLGALLRTASRLRLTPLVASLRALNAQHSTPTGSRKWQRVASITSGLHGPRNFEYGYDVGDQSAYLERCKARFPDSVSARFFHSLASGRSLAKIQECDPIPPIRVAFFGGISAARQGRYHEANVFLKEFITLQETDQNNPLSPFGLEEARRTLIDVCRLNGDVEQLLHLIVAAFIERPQSVRRLPVSETFALCAGRKREASVHVEYPILAFLAESDPHQVCLCLKRYLRGRGVETPRALAGLPDMDELSLGTLFLRVCTADVLDSLEALHTVQRVDSERLALLEWVRDNIPQYANLAKSEILLVTQTAQLRDALDTLDQAKVVLDIAGLRNAEKDKFWEAYLRLQAQKDLALARQADSIVNAIRELTATNAGSKLVQIPNPKHAVAAFATAFREVRDAFLGSPYYGLEACLSGQIRHGIIIQHIRNPFIIRNLAVKRSGTAYDEFLSYWQTRGIPPQSQSLGEAVEILSDMTEAIDAIAIEVKDDWIQSRTEERHPLGLFDYSFDDVQIEAVYRSFEFGSASYDSFLDHVFDALLKRTRESLRIVRSRITTELPDRLRKVVDLANRKLTAIDDSALNSIRYELTACRQDIESAVCGSMTRWFQESPTALMSDADFVLIAHTAIGMIERLNPQIRGRFTVTISSEFMVRGRHFRAAVLMIFFLLDNAVQHSGMPLENFCGSLDVVAQGNRLGVKVTAKMQSADKAESARIAVRQRVEQHMRELVPEQVIREGGSGLAKVMATVLYEFDQKNPIIEANSDGDLLSVSVVTQMEGIAA